MIWLLFSVILNQVDVQFKVIRNGKMCLHLISMYQQLPAHQDILLPEKNKHK